MYMSNKECSQIMSQVLNGSEKWCECRWKIHARENYRWLCQPHGILISINWMIFEIYIENILFKKLEAKKRLETLVQASIIQ